MTSLNQIILIGNVAAELESYESKSGKKVVSFPIAIDRQWPEETDNGTREVDYHRVVAWQKLGEICEKIIHTGAKILVRGKLVNHSYETKEGTKKYITEIHAEQIEILKWKNKPEGEIQKMAKNIKKEGKKQKAKA